jgi:hypothetical protein
MKLIILEGVDRTGKSTVANKLKEYLSQHTQCIMMHDHTDMNPAKDFKYMFHSADPNFYSKTIEYATFQLMGIYQSAKQDAVIIADRLHLSDDVYGDFYRIVARNNYLRGRKDAHFQSFEYFIQRLFDVSLYVFNANDTFEFKDDTSNVNFVHKAESLKSINSMFKDVYDFSIIVDKHILNIDNSFSLNVFEYVLKHSNLQHV